MVKKSTIESIIREDMADMWALLNPDEKRIITDNFHIQTFKKNEMIYSEGEKATQLMCLIKGKVKIFKEGVGGRSQIIRLIRPVQYFGYRAYFAGENYVTAASAFETATIGFLLMLKDNYGLEEDGATLSIYMAREDLANLSNMTTSNAIRTLSCFSNEKIIIVDGRKIKIIDEAKLRKISRFG